jgi:hypothetical protein
MSEVSVPNAVESNDDDTEPTKPYSNPIINGVMNQNKQQDSNKNNNVKPQQKTYNYNDDDDENDDISDLELPEKNNKIISNVIISSASGGGGGQVKKNLALIEKQLKDISNKGTKPGSNAIPTFKSALPIKKVFFFFNNFIFF